jgi:hypothetical protein
MRDLIFYRSCILVDTLQDKMRHNNEYQDHGKYCFALVQLDHGCVCLDDMSNANDKSKDQWERCGHECFLARNA